MKFEWEMFKSFDEGKRSLFCDALISIDYGLLDSGTIRDNTTEYAKRTAKSAVCAYEISGFKYLDRKVLADIFRENGLTEGLNEDFYFCGNNIRLFRNEGNGAYRGTPKRTVYEVMDMLEKAYAKSFVFDYKAELNKFIEKLDKRQSLMHEANAYLEKIEELPDRTSPEDFTPRAYVAQTLPRVEEEMII